MTTDSIARSDLFFLITTIAVIVITVLILIFLLYSIRIVRDVRKISEHAREEADAIISDVDAVRVGIKEGGKKGAHKVKSFFTRNKS